MAVKGSRGKKGASKVKEVKEVKKVTTYKVVVGTREERKSDDVQFTPLASKVQDRLDKLVAAGTLAAGELGAGQLTLLSKLHPTIAAEKIHEFSETDFAKVNNKAAWFTGMLTKQVTKPVERELSEKVQFELSKLYDAGKTSAAELNKNKSLKILANFEELHGCQIVERFGKEDFSTIKDKSAYFNGTMKSYFRLQPKREQELEMVQCAVHGSMRTKERMRQLSAGWFCKAGSDRCSGVSAEAAEKAYMMAKKKERQVESKRAREVVEASSADGGKMEVDADQPPAKKQKKAKKEPKA